MFLFPVTWAKTAMYESVLDTIGQKISPTKLCGDDDKAYPNN